MNKVDLFSVRSTFHQRHVFCVQAVVLLHRDNNLQIPLLLRVEAGRGDLHRSRLRFHRVDARGRREVGPGQKLRDIQHRGFQPLFDTYSFVTLKRYNPRTAQVVQKRKVS